MLYGARTSRSMSYLLKCTEKIHYDEEDYLSTKNINYEDRLKSLNLPSLEFRRTRGDMIETFKIIRGLRDIHEMSCMSLVDFMISLALPLVSH